MLKDGALKSAIEQQWGSVEVFKKEFNTATAGIQGSGWGWLVRLGAWLANQRVSMMLRLTFARQGYSPANKRLEIVTTSNQDPLLTHVPIIGVDIWEHAFYLQYLNVKADVSFCNRLSSICLLKGGTL